MNYHVAFVGNPNVGKSAWINALSNADFKVGNWPGVTVEKKEANVCWGGDSYYIVDLPGTYSLTNSGNEESITAAYLQSQQVDLIVNVLDATNLQRNLMLTLFLRELQIPMLLIFNFMDEVKAYGIHIDTAALSRRLGIEILAYSAFDRRHYREVRQAIQKQVKQETVFYHPLLNAEEDEIYTSLYTYIEQHLPPHAEASPRLLHRLALECMRGDLLVMKQLDAWHMDTTVLQTLCRNMNEENVRIGYCRAVESLMHSVSQDPKKRYAKSERIDALVLHRWLGLPLFLLVFSFLLLFVFQASAPLNDYIGYLLQDVLARYVSFALQWAPYVVRQFLLQGILAGVGGVLVFVPLMALLYFVLSLLEESGYMARIAFLLDRLMNSFHLSGKSFVSLMLGFGCNVPAIYATRTLDNEQQKRLTALLVPFMSCGARLPVYVLFASAFFPDKAAWMMLSIYGIGILLALVLALLASRFPIFHDDAMLVLELPPYRLPSLRVVLHKVKEEVKSYVRKACGIVLWAMVILWGLTYFPNGSVEDSFLAQGAKLVQPVFAPLGFGDRWECVAALPGGIIAKETIVGFLDTVLQPVQQQEASSINIGRDIRDIVYKGGNALKESAAFFLHTDVAIKPQKDAQVSHIRALWTGADAGIRSFSFMVYVLLSIPCIMTLQAVYHEYGKKLLLLTLVVMLAVPYLTSLFIFQFFSLFL
ncbi:ferrous iron transport protein B [[Clostridium] innocuum]|nr:ferrous iron transport protein B [[Clostridium] innocuum]MCR0578953.1 ferrous iron transport protein B [[Clostridium] innocuum]